MYPGYIIWSHFFSVMIKTNHLWDRFMRDLPFSLNLSYAYTCNLMLGKNICYLRNILPWNIHVDLLHVETYSTLLISFTTMPQLFHS